MSFYPFSNISLPAAGLFSLCIPLTLLILIYNDIISQW